MDFGLLIFGCWIVFMAYWAISAFNTKKNVYRQRNMRWRFPGIVIMVAIFFISQLPYVPSYLRRNPIPQTAAVGIVGVALCAAGIAFAIWARWHLGRNWSGTPSLKEGHELVTSGPYRYVRHPIYTGIILAFLGSALIGGTLWMFAFVFLFITFLARVGAEERLMMQQFPDQYPEYKKRTKTLIPFVF